MDGVYGSRIKSAIRHLNRHTITGSRKSNNMKILIALSVYVAAVCANSQYPAYPKEDYPAKEAYPAKEYSTPAYPAKEAYPAPTYPSKEYAAPSYPAQQKQYPAPAAKYEEPPQPPKPYNFGYAVKDDEHYTDFQRQETSDGKVVSGSYRVALPDGRTQTVTYKAGPDGSVVDVTYEGEAQYPEYVPPKKDYPTPAYPKKEYPVPVYPKEAYPAPAYPKKEYPTPAYPKESYPARDY